MQATRPRRGAESRAGKSSGRNALCRAPSSCEGRMPQAAGCALAPVGSVVAAKVRPCSGQGEPVIRSASIRFRPTPQRVRVSPSESRDQCRAALAPALGMRSVGAWASAPFRRKQHPPIGRGSTLLQPQLFYDCLMTSICLEPYIQTTNKKQIKNKQTTRLKRHNSDLKQQKVVCLLRV